MYNIVYMEKNERNSEIQESEQLTAQKLHTRIYLENGYINESQLDDNGLFVDEYTDRSKYFYIKNEAKETACRYIVADEKEGLRSLPTIKNFNIDYNKLAGVAHVNDLSDLDPCDVIEVSGLVSDIDKKGLNSEAFDTTKQIYTKLLRESLDRGYKLWVMNVDERLEKYFSLVLGRNSVVRLGEPHEYIGDPTIPIALNPQDVVKNIMTSKGHLVDIVRAHLVDMIEGVKEDFIDDDLISILHLNGVKTS